MTDVPHDTSKRACLLAYITGLVNQKVLLQNEYPVAENRIFRAYLPARPRLSDNKRLVARKFDGFKFRTSLLGRPRVAPEVEALYSPLRKAGSVPCGKSAHPNFFSSLLRTWCQSAGPFTVATD